MVKEKKVKFDYIKDEWRNRNTVLKIKKHYDEGARINDENITLIAEPFKALVLKNMFHDQFLENVKKEVKNEFFVEKNNDLYSFHQSDDLKNCENNFLSEIRSVIYDDEFLSLLTTITGIELNNTVDISASKYSNGDYLLCHDDDIKSSNIGRRIAFIVYLVDQDWMEEDGGFLELIKCNYKGLPTIVESRILPSWNSMAVFEIGNHSYHQVSEVLSKSKDRLSIVGWFHGPIKPKINPIYKIKAPTNFICSLDDYVNSEYLRTDIIPQMKSVFDSECVICLYDFFTPEIFSRLCQVENNPNWRYETQPLNIRKFQTLDFEIFDKSDVVFKAKQFFQSKIFIQYLEKIADLEIANVYGNLRKFNKSDYTLINDEALEPTGIDLVYFLSSSDWPENVGGKDYYVCGEETIIDILPIQNALYLVFRNDETLRFTKRLSNQAPCSRVDFSFTYMPK